MKEAIINVKGMVCRGCENRVKNALKEIDGVEEVEADYNTGIVKVLADEIVKRKTLEDVIEDIEFEVVKEN